MQAHLQLDPALVASSAPDLAAGLGAFAEHYEALARASAADSILGTATRAHADADADNGARASAAGDQAAGIPVADPAPLETAAADGDARGVTGGQFGQFDAGAHLQQQKEARKAAPRGGRTKSAYQTGALASLTPADRSTVRKERNRLAAQRSRDRKAAEFERLERLAEDKTQENSILERELALYKKRVKDLEGIVRALQAGAPVDNIHLVDEPVLPPLPTLDKVRDRLFCALLGDRPTDLAPLSLSLCQPLHDQGHAEDTGEGDLDLNLG